MPSTRRWGGKAKNRPRGITGFVGIEKGIIQGTMKTLIAAMTIATDMEKTAKARPMGT
jgi:hypothetical protein